VRAQAVGWRSRFASDRVAGRTDPDYFEPLTKPSFDEAPGLTDWLFPSLSRPGEHLTTRPYGRVVDAWVTLIGLHPAGHGTHRLRRMKVALIYRRTGTLRICRLLLGHTKLERTARYLGIEQMRRW
jgi:site-specific recombinase XerD